MTDLSPRPSRTPSRRSREDRAFKLVVAGGVATVVALVTFVLALVTSVSFGYAVVAALVAAFCGWMFRRTVS